MKLRWFFVTVALLFLVVAGCTKDENASLKTVPVVGKLTERGGKEVTGGMLEFRPAGDAKEGNGRADVGPGGSFSAKTLTRKKPKDGLTPGNYQVSYFPTTGGDQIVEPFLFDGELTVPAGGFTDANPLKLELPFSKKK